MDRALGNVLLFPFRRRLMAVTIAWLSGIAGALYVRLPMGLTLLLCALLACIGILRCRRRESALLFGMAVMALLGNACAGSQLSRRDAASLPGATISGTVMAIESTTRVWLRDVTVEDGPSPERPVIVTLMTQEGEESTGAQVGQRLSGTGRLFAPEEARNPGDGNRRIQALCEGYELSGYLLPGWEVQGEPVFSLREAIRRMRLAVLGRIEAVFGEAAPLFQALMLGERREMDAGLTEALRLTGTSHVLTVSGLHLGMIAAALDALLRRLRPRRRLRLAVQMLVLGFFACLSGAAPGTIRALIMAVLRAVASCRGRRYEPLTALSFAALVMTVCCPVLLFSGSFQFSFFVVLGMQMLGGRFRAARLRARRRRIPRGRLVQTVVQGACAQAAAIPMTLRFYGYVPLLALPMNLLCGGIMPLLLLGGWAVTALSVISLEGARLAARALAVPARCFETLSMAAASLSGATVRLPAPYAASLLLVLLLMALGSDRIRFGTGRGRAALCAAVLLLASYALRFVPAARYVQLDVGQGDAAILRSGRGCVLIDVGPEDSYDMLRYLRFEGLTPSAVVLSHLDEDHAGALGTLLRSEVEIGPIYLSVDAGEETATEPVREALALAREMELPVREVERGGAIEAGGFHLDVLSPDGTLMGSNERSLVLSARVEGTTLLMAGDLPIGSEREDFPDCELLKVAHHGSKYATSAEFLQQTTPELALISVGADNRYGHPTGRVLEDLSLIGARVLRTDQAGCITVWLIGERRLVQTFLR